MDDVLDEAHPGHRISEDAVLHLGPPADLLLGRDTTRDLHFVGMPPGSAPRSSATGSGRGNRTTSAAGGCHARPRSASTDYKVQGRTLGRAALELQGTRTVSVNGRAIPGPCDPYSLYVRLSRSRSLDIMLVSEARKRDFMVNKVSEGMVAAEARLERLSEATVEEAETWDWGAEGG